jgi:hypothetical protein
MAAPPFVVGDGKELKAACRATMLTHRVREVIVALVPVRRAARMRGRKIFRAKQPRTPARATNGHSRGGRYVSPA